jgi:sugar phosphate isomerase/epimerase
MSRLLPPAPAGHAAAGRRTFLKTAAVAAGAGLLPEAAAATPAGVVGTAGDARQLTEAEKATRLASNTYPLRSLFKRRPSTTEGMGGGTQAQAAEAMKKKYGEITMLDVPQFTIDHFPGVRKMDLWSSLFGDVTNDAMFQKTPWEREGRRGVSYEFDPTTPAAKAWLDQLNARMAKTGVTCHHVSNNAPRNISDLDADLRRKGIETAKVWLDACAAIGAKTMRVNTGGPRIVPGATATTGYPRNDEIVKYIRHAVDSFKEMADHGGKVGVKVTIENHWGLSADPMNMRIILDEVNHPFCEASPDFCNWEHEYLLYHGLEAVMPYTHTTVHAKYWNRWENVDLQRCVRILNHAGFKGVIALEYEDGPWDGVQGAQHLMKEVMAAL